MAVAFSRQLASESSPSFHSAGLQCPPSHHIQKSRHPHGTAEGATIQPPNEGGGLKICRRQIINFNLTRV